MRYKVQVFPTLKRGGHNRLTKRTFFLRAENPFDAFENAKAIAYLLERRTVDHSMEDAVIDLVTSPEQEDLVP